MQELFAYLLIPVGFLSGYHFCKKRYMIKELLKSNEILTSLVSGKITHEEAHEQIKVLTDEIEV